MDNLNKTDRTIEVPKINYFRTLLKHHCVGVKAGKKDGEIKYYILLPGDWQILPITLERCYKFERYTFHALTEAQYMKCLDANVGTVQLKDVASRLTVNMIMVDREHKETILSVSMPGMGTVLYYKVSGNKVTCSGKQWVGLNKKELPGAFRFNNAERLEKYQGEDRSLSLKNVHALYSGLSDREKSVFNGVWRYFPEKFKAETVLAICTYLGAGSDVDRPFAMIPIMEFWDEDPALFDNCFVESECEYTAIVNAQIRSALRVDQDLLLSVIRQNPTCRTSDTLRQVLKRRVQKEGVGS
jgi:hypothetical protein